MVVAYSNNTEESELKREIATPAPFYPISHQKVNSLQFDMQPFNFFLCLYQWVVLYVLVSGSHCPVFGCTLIGVVLPYQPPSQQPHSFQQPSRDPPSYLIYSSSTHFSSVTHQSSFPLLFHVAVFLFMYCHNVQFKFHFSFPCLSCLISPLCFSCDQ